MPSATAAVTFLFTDIEGSTKLWEQKPEAMSAALVRHDALLHQAIAAQEGIVFKTMGDAFCAAFPSASQALSAALAAQQALQAEPWPEDVTLWIRMALHTGSVEQRNGDYFGPPLNRVARLLSAGHGGQTLLSQSAYELIRDALPPQCDLQDLGSHALRDLARPEQIFQLLHPALQSYFPPLKSLDNPETPNNLPQQMTSFIGREKELAQIKTLLSATRLLTLTGSGGAGKTRLSLQTAADVLDDYPDGVWLIELAPITNPDLVPQVVANVLGVKDQAGQTLTQTLSDWLKPKQLLLLLDNCEHLLSACAVLADTLLRACPNLHILASSREGLNVSGEQAYRVPSLSLPAPKTIVTSDNVSQYEAIRLFIERATLVKPAFAVTNANALSVASVCHRVDGIPLALELAAARVRSLSVEEINGRLDNRFRLLTGGARTALPRQQTLRALIDWSYDLLTEKEKKLLCRLSVFAGGWTLEAAEAICAGADIEDWEMLDLITSLVDKSLVNTEDREGQTRYHLLETVRQYGRDRLAESDESGDVRNKHAAYFRTLAETAAPKFTGAEQTTWLARLETEHGNLRSALAWFSEMPEDTGAPQSRLRLAGALHAFWSVRGYMDEGRRHLSEALAAPGAQARTKVRAEALQGLGTVTRLMGDAAGAHSLYEESLAIRREVGDRQGVTVSLLSLGNIALVRADFALARTRYEESLAVGREVGNKTGIANALANLGLVALHQGNYAEARPRYEEGLMIFSEAGNRLGIGNMLGNLGLIAQYEGDYPKARVLYEESLEIRRELGHKMGIADMLNNLGVIAHFQHDYAQARIRYEESLSIQRELRHRRGIAMAILNLANLALAQNDFDASRLQFEESLTLFRALGHKDAISNCLEGMGNLAVAQDNPLRAARLWGAAEALREAIETPLPTDEKESHDRTVAETREAAGEAVFDSAWAEGRAMPWEQAVDEALGK